MKLFLFCYVRKETRYDMIDALNSTSSYLDDLPNIDDIHFEQISQRICPAEFNLTKVMLLILKQLFRL